MLVINIYKINIPININQVESLQRHLLQPKNFIIITTTNAFKMNFKHSIVTLTQNSKGIDWFMNSRNIGKK